LAKTTPPKKGVRSLAFFFICGSSLGEWFDNFFGDIWAKMKKTSEIKPPLIDIMIWQVA
jgi:hypothetical protein